jgi:hypothetical protein
MASILFGQKCSWGQNIFQLTCTCYYINARITVSVSQHDKNRTESIFKSVFEVENPADECEFINLNAQGVNRLDDQSRNFVANSVKIARRFYSPAIRISTVCRMPPLR